MVSLYCELNETEERKKEYEQAISTYAFACEQATRFLLTAIELMSSTTSDDTRYCTGVVFLLARHAAEQLDGVSVLVAKSCVEPSKQLLRSVFEALLQIRYLVEADSENRALAYHVSELHHYLDICRRLDLNDDCLDGTRKTYANDPIAAEIVSTIKQSDVQSRRKKLEKELAEPPLDVIEQEWQRSKGSRKSPPWYSLFNGPRTMRDLAKHLNKSFWYEFVYSEWSQGVHGKGIFKQVGKMSDNPGGNTKAVKTLRHPEGINNVCDYAYGMADEIVNVLSDKYLGQITQGYLQGFYVKEIQPAIHKAQQTRLSARWK